MTKREALYGAICGIIFLVCMALKVNMKKLLKPELIYQRLAISMLIF